MSKTSCYTYQCVSVFDEANERFGVTVAGPAVVVYLQRPQLLSLLQETHTVVCESGQVVEAQV